MLYEAFYTLIAWAFPDSILNVLIPLPLTDNTLTVGNLLIIVCTLLTLAFIYLVFIRQLARLFKKLVRDNGKRGK